MDIPVKTYKIILPQGQAERSIFELSLQERLDVGVEIFERVKKLAAEVGEEPVVAKLPRTYLNKKLR